LVQKEEILLGHDYLGAFETSLAIHPLPCLTAHLGKSCMSAFVTVMPLARKNGLSSRALCGSSFSTQM
jgi:hypothetical protein